MKQQDTRSDLGGLYSDENKQIVQRRGGWFVTGESWSGPWRTQQCAELALEGKFNEARELQRNWDQ